MICNHLSCYIVKKYKLMIQLKWHRVADTGLVVGLGAASGTAELCLAAQFTEKPGVGYCAYFCVFT